MWPLPLTLSKKAHTHPPKPKISGPTIPKGALFINLAQNVGSIPVKQLVKNRGPALARSPFALGPRGPRAEAAVTVGRDGLLFTKPGSGLVWTRRPQMSARLGPATCCAPLAIPVLVQRPIHCPHPAAQGAMPPTPGTRGSGAGSCHTDLAAR